MRCIELLSVFKGDILFFIIVFNYTFCSNVHTVIKIKFFYLLFENNYLLFKNSSKLLFYNYLYRTHLLLFCRNLFLQRNLELHALNATDIFSNSIGRPIL